MRASVAECDLDLALQATGARRRLLLEQVLAVRLLAAQLAGAGLLEALGRASWVFIFGIVWSPGRRLRRGVLRSRLDGRFGRLLLLRWSSRFSSLAACSFFAAWALLVGRQHHRHVAAVELRRGFDLRQAAPRCSATWSRIFMPSSGWDTSRPRNMIVTFTLWPSARNSATLRVLVSKSPCPILGRYFISLIETLRALAP